MNIAFWLIIIVLLVVIWFVLSRMFPSIGSFLMGYYDGAKSAMDKDEQEKVQERKDGNQNVQQ